MRIHVSITGWYTYALLLESTAKGLPVLDRLIDTTACSQNIVRASLQEVSTGEHVLFQVVQMSCAFGRESQGVADLEHLHHTSAFRKKTFENRCQMWRYLKHRCLLCALTTSCLPGTHKLAAGEHRQGITSLGQAHGHHSMQYTALNTSRRTRPSQAVLNP